MKIAISIPWGFAAPKIMRGFASAFSRMGHSVHVIRPHELITVKLVQDEVRRLVKFKPDFVVGYGFSAILKVDRTHLFAMLGIPVIHYFADDPFHPSTAGDIELTRSDGISSIWVWDRSYLEPLRKIGYANPVYLPLAVNDQIYSPQALDTLPVIYSHDITFAGNGDITRRLPFLEKVVDLNLEVFGDEPRWRRHAGNSTILNCHRGFLNSEEELFTLYRTSKINLNITVGQGRTSANQRVFDVTASGGFLLSDHKEELEELFDTGKEIACFRTPEELREKVKYYLNNNDERKKIAEAGRLRVLKEHTYIHRVKIILDQMEKSHREVAEITK